MDHSFLGVNIFQYVINQNNTKKEEDFIEGVPPAGSTSLTNRGRAFRHSAIAPAASLASLSPVAADLKLRCQSGVATIPNARKSNCICKYLYYFLKCSFKIFLHHFIFIIKEWKPYQNIPVFFFHYDMFKSIPSTYFFEEFFFPAVIVFSC